tara:strand:- start:1330 stop:1509 length:180 start_codon:yes stop_codon:yes gene_type:complete
MSIFEETDPKYIISVEVKNEERFKELMEILAGNFTFRVNTNQKYKTIDDLFKEIENVKR